MAKNTPKSRLQAAYALHLPALLALDRRDLQRPRVEIAALSATVLAALPRLSSVLPDLAKQAAPGRDAALLLEFPTRLMALVHAQANVTAYAAPPDDLPALWDRARTLRGLLSRAAITLVDFERLPPGSLASMASRRGRAKADVAMDLLALAALFRQHWATVAACTAVPSELVDEAGRLGDELLTTLGQRDHLLRLRLLAAAKRRLRDGHSAARAAARPSVMGIGVVTVGRTTRDAHRAHDAGRAWARWAPWVVRASRRRRVLSALCF